MSQGNWVMKFYEVIILHADKHESLLQIDNYF